METYIQDHQVLNEGRWKAWLEKGKRRDKMNARRFKVVVGAVLGILAVSMAFLFIPRV